MKAIGTVNNHADSRSLDIIAMWKDSISAIETTKNPFSEQYTHYIIIHDPIHTTYSEEHSEWNRRFTENNPSASIVQYLYSRDNTHYVKGLFAENKAKIYAVIPYTNLDTPITPPQYPASHIGESRKEVLKHILPHIKANTLLDIGCGTGSATLQIAENNPQATVQGIDNSEALVKQCRFNSEVLRITNANFITASAEALPYRDNTFEVVTCLFSLHHIDRMDTALQEMHRVIKEGGRIITADPLEHNGKTTTLKEWKTLIENAGFMPTIREIAGAAVINGKK
jgi:2-polyprenyl-3-methyl-5-hydroxy-6-metoxy-1,4-benzoquinol methylase